jgi:Tfp pilus assembly protein FimT
MCGRQRGMSMLELLITLGIGMILVAMATPLVTTTIRTYRLRAAGGEYANLLQGARIRAVTDDSYYAIYARSAAFAPGVNGFADLNNGIGWAVGTYGLTPAAPKSDPSVGFSTAVSLQPRAAAPNVNNLENQFMPGIPLGVVAINPNDAWAGAATAVVTFGSRGLPCYLPPPGPAVPPGNCPYTVPAAVPQPIAFEIFFRNALINSWEAVTVNPSGRIREWRYNNSSGNWQPLD